jgi:hypothetical protein
VWPGYAPLFWVALGITLYGALYLFVHEVYIHRRTRYGLPRTRYLEWLRSSHALHHRFGGEPYGMLLPIVGRTIRGRATDARPSAQPLDRSGRERVARRTTRRTRARL